MAEGSDIQINPAITADCGRDEAKTCLDMTDDVPRTMIVRLKRPLHKETMF